MNDMVADMADMVDNMVYMVDDMVDDRERRSQAGPKGQKSGRRPPARNRGPTGP